MPLRTPLSWLTRGLLAAVLVKGFWFDAFRIPSPSMQPTLLGSPGAGATDRVLVDTAWYLLHEPRRWDVVAFHPPTDAGELFAKRIVGLPGERLRIAGGDLLLLPPTDAAGDQPVVLRPPEPLRERFWRNVHPARAAARGDSQTLGVSWTGAPDGAWQEARGELRVQLAAGAPATLRWTCPDGGLVDRVWDGCPVDVAKALRTIHHERSELAEIVPDARIGARFAGPGRVDRLSIALVVHRPGAPDLTFAAEWTNGGLRGLVRAGGGLAATSAIVPAPAPVLALEVAHVDDELLVRLDGVQAVRLDTSPWPCRSGCELPDPCGLGPAMPTAEQCVEVRLELQGEGEVALGALRVDRDQHWRRGPLAADAVLEVPQGHYLLLGDNPAQSEDGRGWRTFVLETKDGEVVLPGTVGAARLTGRFEPGDAERAPQRDENPVWLRDRGLVLVTDHRGERRVLRGRPGAADAEGRPTVQAPQGGTDWSIDGPLEHFVPRGAIVGRVGVRFWPLPPFGAWRPVWTH